MPLRGLPADQRLDANEIFGVTSSERPRRVRLNANVWLVRVAFSN